MNLKVFGGPTGHGWRIETEQGDPVSNITAVAFTARVDELSRMKLELFASEVEMEGEATFVVGTPDGEVRPVSKIVFADGSEWVAP